MDLSYRKQFRYPVETVASVAAQLLDGEEYAAAARRALALLDACEAELLHDAVVERVSLDTKQRAATPISEQSFLQSEANLSVKDLSKSECATFVTGEKNEANAFPLFKKVLALTLRWEKAYQPRDGTVPFDSVAYHKVIQQRFEETPRTTAMEVESWLRQYDGKLIPCYMANRLKELFVEMKRSEISEKRATAGRLGAKGKKGRSKNSSLRSS